MLGNIRQFEDPCTVRLTTRAERRTNINTIVNHIYAFKKFEDDHEFRNLEFLTLLFRYMDEYTIFNNTINDSQTKAILKIIDKSILCRMLNNMKEDNRWWEPFLK